MMADVGGKHCGQGKQNSNSGGRTDSRQYPDQVFQSYSRQMPREDSEVRWLLRNLAADSPKKKAYGPPNVVPRGLPEKRAPNR